jgi:hypothetical protein
VNNTSDALKRGRPWLILLALTLIIACVQDSRQAKPGQKATVSEAMQ